MSFPITKEKLGRLIQHGKTVGRDVSHLEIMLSEWEKDPDAEKRFHAEANRGIRSLTIKNRDGREHEIISTTPLDPDSLEDFDLEVTLENLRDALKKAKDAGGDISRFESTLRAWEKEPEKKFNEIIQVVSP